MAAVTVMIRLPLGEAFSHEASVPMDSFCMDSFCLYAVVVFALAFLFLPVLLAQTLHRKP